MTNPESLPLVEVTAIAHGGHAIARLDGQVVFVRHALPGEQVRIRVTERGRRFLRADAVEVITASPDRVEPGCAVAGICGGCDFQHVSDEGQRRLLAEVVEEQLRRIAGLSWNVEVESVGSNLGWRTRMDWAVTGDGELGLRRHRSHEVIRLDSCPIAHPDLPMPQGPVPGERLGAVVSSSGERALISNAALSEQLTGDVDGWVSTSGEVQSGLRHVTETVHGHRFLVNAAGFWQVHPQAAEALVDAVMEAAEIRAGDSVFDLYCGGGLFTAFLTDAVGPTGQVYAVEGSRTGAEDARTNVGDRPGVRVLRAPVERALEDGRLPQRADVVVLDPPRAGAKLAIRSLASRHPRKIVHVACDPASLARDVSLYTEHGYRLTALRAFALFPMTHHVECVAVLEPSGH